MGFRRAICLCARSCRVSIVPSIVQEETYSKTQPTPTHLTRPPACLTFSSVRTPPSLKTTCVIPTLLSLGSVPSTGEELDRGFHVQFLTHLAPICCRSSMNMPLASSPSVVWTSTCTTAPWRTFPHALIFRPGLFAGLAEDATVGSLRRTWVER